MKSKIKLVNGEEVIAVKVERRVELMGQVPVKFYLAVTNDKGKAIEINYDAVVSIEVIE